MGAQDAPSRDYDLESRALQPVSPVSTLPGSSGSRCHGERLGCGKAFLRSLGLYSPSIGRAKALVVSDASVGEWLVVWGGFFHVSWVPMGGWEHAWDVPQGTVA